MTAVLEPINDLIDGHLRELAGLYARLNGQRTAKARLSPRELEIALLAAATPLTYIEMGARLYLSASTVKTHLLRAYTKLGIHRRHQLQGVLRGMS